MRNKLFFILLLVLTQACSTYVWDYPNKKVGSISIQNLQQTTITIPSSNSVTILHFWAFNHPLSRNSLSYMNELSKKANAVGIRFISVCLNWSGSETEIIEFMKKNKFTFETVFDYENKLGRIYEVTSIPQTQIISTSNSITHRLMGLREDIDYVNEILYKAK